MKSLLPIFLILIWCCSMTAQQKQYVVLFDYNKSEIPDSAMIALIKIIAANTIDQVLIEGHCDSIGTSKYNYALSERRANEVKKLMVQNGIKSQAIKTCIGYGEDQPVTLQNSEQDRQRNRRVVINYTLLGETKSQVIKKPLEMKDFEEGKQIVLDNLLFEGGRHILKPESTPVLENLCDIMHKNPNLKIEVQGHVCCTTFELDGYDVDTKTDNLSVNRAQMVCNYLIKHCGIAKERLRYKGFGGTQKLIQNDVTEEQQKVNRRVELKVLEN